MIDRIAVELGDHPQFNRKRRLHDRNDLLQICPGFISVTLDSEKWVVSIAHYSVQEYLESDRLRKQEVDCFSLNSTTSSTEIAQTCLVYFLDPILLNAEAIYSTMAELPLLQYAAKYWYQHVNGDGACCFQILSFVLQLFNNQNYAFRNCIRIYDPNHPWYRPFGAINEIVTPTYYSSLLGFYSVLCALLKILNENAQIAEYGKSILDRNADVNAQGGRFGNALQAASLGGHKEIVQLLLDRSADVNAQGGVFDDAIQAASYKGHEERVQLLRKESTKLIAVMQRNTSAAD